MMIKKRKTSNINHYCLSLLVIIFIILLFSVQFFAINDILSDTNWKLEEIYKPK